MKKTWVRVALTCSRRASPADQSSSSVACCTSHLPGDDFKDWKTYSISIPDNECFSCHRMAVSNMAFHDGPTYGGGGTGRMFGIIATDIAQFAKNPHSASSPIWMTPGDATYSAEHAKEAKQISECALQFVKNKFDSTKPLPYSCSVSKLPGAFHP